MTYFCQLLLAINPFLFSWIDVQHLVPLTMIFSCTILKSGLVGLQWFRSYLKNKLLNCLHDIHKQMSQNLLQLNANKAEIMIIGPDSTFILISNTSWLFQGPHWNIKVKFFGQGSWTLEWPAWEELSWKLCLVFQITFKISTFLKLLICDFICFIIFWFVLLSLCFIML